MTGKSIILLLYIIICILVLPVLETLNRINLIEFKKETFNQNISNIFNYWYEKIEPKNFFHTGQVIKLQPNKVDIIILNHRSTFDAAWLVFYLNEMGINNPIAVLSNYLKKIPGFGLIGKMNNYIFLKKKWLEDKSYIHKQIKKLTNGLIFITIEGTRFNKKKWLKSIKYGQENNIPYYKNLLIPKTKGLNLIIETLLMQNKLGNIWDGTFYLPEISNHQSGYYDDVKNLKHIWFKTEKIDKKELLAGDFRQNIYKIWDKKDKLLESKFKNEKMKLIPRRNYELNHEILVIVIFIIALIIFRKLGIEKKVILGLIVYHIIYLFL